ncbi:MAG: hypothetical protein EXS39_01490 [Opitutaceae bacterium]|nr:hypothetical protein [Opitutaceae bacterium]
MLRVSGAKLQPAWMKGTGVTDPGYKKTYHRELLLQSEVIGQVAVPAAVAVGLTIEPERPVADGSVKRHHDLLDGW